MDASTWTTWVFYLTIFDGKYVDKISAQVGITLFPLLDMNINQENGCICSLFFLIEISLELLQQRKTCRLFSIMEKTLKHVNEYLSFSSIF